MQVNRTLAVSSLTKAASEHMPETRKAHCSGIARVAADTLEAGFHKNLEQLLDPLVATGDGQWLTSIAVAVSGGADSLALTLLAHDWAGAHGASLIALTIDHRLREDSTHEANHVAKQMATHGIVHHILTPAHQPAGNNLMQAARTWRYNALAEFCHAHAIAHCLLGHHFDDQLETVALAHLRGRTTLDLAHERSEGEAGMRELRLYRGVHFLRPLLTYRKHQLVDYLTARHVPWVEDPSNADPRFARASIRQALRDDPTLDDALQTMLANRSAARDARDAALAAAMPACVQPTHTSTRLHLAAWKTLEPELRSLMLANLLRSIGGKPHRPRRHETERLAQALLNEPRGKRTLGHCVIAWKAGTADIHQELRA